MNDDDEIKQHQYIVFVLKSIEYVSKKDNIMFYFYTLSKLFQSWAV